MSSSLKMAQLVFSNHTPVSCGLNCCPLPPGVTFCVMKTPALGFIFVNVALMTVKLLLVLFVFACWINTFEFVGFEGGGVIPCMAGCVAVGSGVTVRAMGGTEFGGGVTPEGAVAMIGGLGVMIVGAVGLFSTASREPSTRARARST